jgi:hypothetical protein
MSKHRVTLSEIEYCPAGQCLKFVIPKGCRVFRATNLERKEGKWRYWLARVPMSLRGNFQFESWHRNYGFLLEENETGYTG